MDAQCSAAVDTTFSRIVARTRTALIPRTPTIARTRGIVWTVFPPTHEPASAGDAAFLEIVLEPIFRLENAQKRRGAYARRRPT